MTAKHSSDPIAVVEQMAAKIEAHEVPQFTDDDAQALRDVAAIWRTLEGLGRLAGTAKTIVQYIVWATAAWVLFKGGAIDWLKGAVK